MACTGHISFDFKLQVYFSEKKSSVITQIYLIAILLNRNISWVMNILKILQSVSAGTRKTWWYASSYYALTEEVVSTE